MFNNLALHITEHQFFIQVLGRLIIFLWSIFCDGYLLLTWNWPVCWSKLFDGVIYFKKINWQTNQWSVEKLKMFPPFRSINKFWLIARFPYILIAATAQIEKSATKQDFPLWVDLWRVQFGQHGRKLHENYKINIFGAKQWGTWEVTGQFFGQSWISLGETLQNYDRLPEMTEYETLWFQHNYACS